MIRNLIKLFKSFVGIFFNVNFVKEVGWMLIAIL